DPVRRRPGGRVLLSHDPCLSLRWLTGGIQRSPAGPELVTARGLVTDSAGHDIPAPASDRRPRLPQSTPPTKATKLPSDSCLIRPRAAERKGPGQRLRTGVRPVGHGLGP